MCREITRARGHQLAAQGPAWWPGRRSRRWPGGARPSSAGRRAAAPGRATVETSWERGCAAARCSSATVVDPAIPVGRKPGVALDRRAPLRSAGEDAVERRCREAGASAAGARHVVTRSIGVRRHKCGPSERPFHQRVPVCARRRRRPSAHGGAGTPRPRSGRARSSGRVFDGTNPSASSCGARRDRRASAPVRAAGPASSRAPPVYRYADSSWSSWLGLRADQARLASAVLERINVGAHSRRSASSRPGCRDVELRSELALRSWRSLEHRGDHLARATPLRPESTSTGVLRP